MSADLMEAMRLKVMEQKQNLFDVWMLQESDLIQSVGEAFGDQVVYNYCCNMVKNKAFGETNHLVMEQVVILYGLTIVKKNLGWYLSNNAFSMKVGKQLDDTISKVVKQISPYVDGLVDGFKLEGRWYAPIAEDYLSYNSKPNNGELGALPKL